MVSATRIHGHSSLIPPCTTRIGLPAPRSRTTGAGSTVMTRVWSVVDSRRHARREQLGVSPTHETTASGSGSCCARAADDRDLGQRNLDPVITQVRHPEGPTG